MTRPRAFSRPAGRVARVLDRLRLRGYPGERGQTMPLVLGIIMLLSLGSIMLVQNTFEQYPIVSQDVIEHQAYRAMEAGVNEYLYAVNANGDVAACDANFVNASGSSVGSTPTAIDNSGICDGLTYGGWTQVPGSASANGAPSWFMLDDPVINTSTGYLSIDVVGLAGYSASYQYQTAVVTLQPLNSFLLNVLWMNYDQVAPTIVQQYNGGSQPACTYYWSNGNSLENNCERLDFISADSLTGNTFVNDSVFVCGAPSFQNLQTADPNQQFVQDGGCSGTPTASGSESYGVPQQSIPSDNTLLLDDAEQDGCVFQGPTQITFSGSNMTVSSPDTPTGTPSGSPNGTSSNDQLNLAENTVNKCMAGATGGTVPLPDNGVVYVSDCGPSSTTTCNGNTDPLANAGESGFSGKTYGDAIVQGTVSEPLTVGAENNIVIDGNLCNVDTLNSSGQCKTGTTPATPSPDVLGLVANNDVEVNHPVDSHGNNESNCSATPGSGATTCDLSNPIIDAVSLTLNGSFLVNNYTSGSSLGTLNVYGTIDQDWRGPVGTFNSGGSVASGYAKNYQYDPRLTYLSPPFYLNPGTSQWGFASFTVASGACKLAALSTSGRCGVYP